MLSAYRVQYLSVIWFLAGFQSRIGTVSVNQLQLPPDQTTAWALPRSHVASQSPGLEYSHWWTASFSGSGRVEVRYGAHSSSDLRLG